MSQSQELTPLLKADLIQVDFDTEQTINVQDWFPAFAETSFSKAQEMQVARVLWQDGHQTLSYDLALRMSYE